MLTCLVPGVDMTSTSSTSYPRNLHNVLLVSETILCLMTDENLDIGDSGG